jgi:hypothetical protein
MVIRSDDDPPIWLKLYATDRVGRLPVRHQFLEDRRQKGDVSFCVPRILGYWPESRVVALGHCQGIPVASLMEGRAYHDADLLYRGAVAAAQSLHTLQRSGFNPGRSWTGEDEARIVERTAGTLIGSGLLHEAALTELGGALADALKRIDADDRFAFSPTIVSVTA